MELQLTPNPAYDDKRTSVGDGMYVDHLISPWICPITGLEINGRFKIVFPWSSGRLGAERAVKLLQKDPAESANSKEEDLVVLNPEEEELDLMNSNMSARRARVKAEKKAAKEAKKNKHSEFKTPAAIPTTSAKVEICSFVKSGKIADYKPLIKREVDKKVEPKKESQPRDEEPEDEMLKLILT